MEGATVAALLQRRLSTPLEQTDSLHPTLLLAPLVIVPCLVPLSPLPKPFPLPISSSAPCQVCGRFSRPCRPCSPCAAACQFIGTPAHPPLLPSLLTGECRNDYYQ